MGRKDDFTPRFEGKERLEALLELAGARVDAKGALEAMRAALGEGRAPAEVFPELFEGEPRFPDPRLAQALFENLFGAWEALQGGARPEALLKEAPPPRPKRERPPAPERWDAQEPTEAWVELAWRYLDADLRARERLWHSFENRQDALLGWLDDQDLTDDGYGVLRLLFSELSAMIELGSGAPLATAEVPAAEAGEVPQALWTYAEEAVFEAGQDEEAPLAPDETEKVRRLARAGLHALFAARRT